MRVLVTAGPTLEPIDPVRFISNRSSGRMGYAIAEALVASGHDVVLISGPVALSPPEGAKVVPVETADEMLKACWEEWPTCQALVAAAAVADWRPEKRSQTKLDSDRFSHLRLVANPDILAVLAEEKAGRLVVGFALQDQAAEEKARVKMEEKGMDWVVLNGLEVQGSLSAEVVLIGPDGIREEFGPSPKAVLAEDLVRRLFPAS